MFAGRPHTSFPIQTKAARAREGPGDEEGERDEEGPKGPKFVKILQLFKSSEHMLGFKAE